MTTRVLSGENSADLIPDELVNAVHSSLPSWSRSSMVGDDLPTSNLYFGATMRESVIPSTMPASWSEVASASTWTPSNSVIHLAFTDLPRMHFSIEPFNSQTELLPDTTAVASTSPLSDITDTFRASSAARNVPSGVPVIWKLTCIRDRLEHRTLSRQVGNVRVPTGKHDRRGRNSTCCGMGT